MKNLSIQRTLIYYLLVIHGVLPPVQLVHHHFPHAVAAGGALLGVAVAPVGGSEGEGVGPVGRVSQRSHHAAVVQETRAGQSRELSVTSQLEEGRCSEGQY